LSRGFVKKDELFFQSYFVGLVKCFFDFFGVRGCLFAENVRNCSQMTVYVLWVLAIWGA